MNHIYDFLIKRSPTFTQGGVISKRNSDRKHFSETRVNAKDRVLPKGLENGSMIFVSEPGWGIYASGKVTEVCDPIQFKNADEIMEYIVNTNSSDSNYWISVMKKLHNKKSKTLNQSVSITFQEYYIEQNLFPRPLPLTGKLSRLSKSGMQSPVIKLLPEEVAFINETNYDEMSLALSTIIPNALKIQIHSFFNKEYSVQHWVDIDHLVPKSVGGPGNIIENLVPIGFSLNRYKGNSIPRGLLVEAKKHDDLKSIISDSSLFDTSEFISNRKIFDEAQKLNQAIWQWSDENKIRSFYKAVMQHHYPNYAAMIDTYYKRVKK